MTNKALTPDMYAFFSDQLIEKMLKQQMRTNDRDNNEAWMQFDNFGDYYAANRHLFMVTFSKLDILVSAIIKGYVMAQLAVMLNRGNKAGRARVDDLVSKAIASKYPQLEAALADKWHREFADIRAKNESKGLFLKSGRARKSFFESNLMMGQIFPRGKITRRAVAERGGR
jgi:hypothetical protein